MKWFWSKCRRHQEELTLLAVGALADGASTGLHSHLAECTDCQARLAELKALAGKGRRLAATLPQMEPSVALRRHWVTEVHGAAASRTEPATAASLRRLSGRRLAYGSLAAVWVAVLLFRFSAPDAAKPASVAVSPPSLREALLVLRVEPRRQPLRADATQPPSKIQLPDSLPPRSQRPDVDATKSTETA